MRIGERHSQGATILPFAARRRQRDPGTAAFDAGQGAPFGDDAEPESLRRLRESRALADIALQGRDMIEAAAVDGRPGGQGLASDIMAVFDESAGPVLARDPNAAGRLAPVRNAIQEAALLREAEAQAKSLRDEIRLTGRDVVRAASAMPALGPLLLDTFGNALNDAELEEGEREALRRELAEAADEADATDLIAADERLSALAAQRQAAAAEARGQAAPLPANAKEAPAEATADLLAQENAAQAVTAASTLTLTGPGRGSSALLSRAAGIALAPVTGLAALFLLLSTRPAGDVAHETRTLLDGTRIEFSLPGDELAGAVSVSYPDGLAFEFGVESGLDDSLVLTTGALVAPDGARRELSGRELARAYRDAIADLDRDDVPLGLDRSVVTIDGGGEGDDDEEKKQGEVAGGRDAVASTPPDGPEDDEDRAAEHSATISDEKSTHIFRNTDGHLTEDTLANRQLLEETVSEENFLGIDKHGTQWYGRLLPDGRQVWVRVRGNKITDAGLNETPRTYNIDTGLSSPTKPSGKR